MNSGNRPPPVLRAEEPRTPSPDPMSAGRAYCALHLLDPWTRALLLWQRTLPERARRGFGRSPAWYAARLRDIADGLLHAADIIEGIERGDA